MNASIDSNMCCTSKLSSGYLTTKRPWTRTVSAIVAALALGLAAANLHQFFASTIPDPMVRAYSSAFPLQVASEIAERRKAFPNERIVLLSRGMVDARGGDAGWLYQPDRVILAESLDGIEGPVVVVACDSLAQTVEGDPHFQIPRTWEDPLVKQGRYVVAERK